MMDLSEEKLFYRYEKGIRTGTKWDAESYRKYRETDKYKQKKEQVLRRDGLQCQLCGTGKNLLVHHITYRRLGNEPLEDLITLCENCHKAVHKNDFQRIKRLKEAKQC